MEMIPIMKRNLEIAKENEPENISCRICYDDEKNEKVIMPCYCVGSLANVHLSCLEDWLTISKIHHCEICKFKFNTVNRTISIFEWIRDKRNCSTLFQHILLMSVFMSIWCMVLFACLFKMMDFIVVHPPHYLVYENIVLCLIMILAAIIIWYWAFIFCKIWQRLSIEVHLDRVYLDQTNNPDIIVEI